jgi:carbon monoxide dehydrogenase subunit G
MSTSTTEVWFASVPEEVLGMLTDPEAIARWAPVGFDVIELDGDRLEAGTQARVGGALAGCRLEFKVHIREAHERCLSLVANGPVSIDAVYRLLPSAGGSTVRASISVSGAGLLGKTLARTLEGLLAAGVLRVSMARIGRELDGAAPRSPVRQLAAA